MINDSSLRSVSRRRSNFILHGRDCFVTTFLAMTLSILLFSCGQEEKSVVVPADVLPKEKMAEVLTDIHIAEAVGQNARTPSFSGEANLKTLPDSASAVPIDIGISFQKIFEKNKITKEQYEKSLSFYIDHPELLNEVYEKVLNELSKMQAGKQ